jgi:REP element-mobilizing transposase RayT
MPQSLAQIYLHIIFSTKDREPLLVEAVFRKRVHAFLAGICQQYESPAIVIGGVDDHVHILNRFGRTIDVATLIREIKREKLPWSVLSPVVGVISCSRTVQQCCSVGSCS